MLVLCLESGYLTQLLTLVCLEDLNFYAHFSDFTAGCFLTRRPRLADRKFARHMRYALFGHLSALVPKAV